MDNVYFRLSIDNASEEVQRQVLTSFNNVCSDIVIRENSYTMLYEIYDRCYFTTSKDIVSMYSIDSGKHFILTGLDGVWISTAITVR